MNDGYGRHHRRDDAGIEPVGSVVDHAYEYALNALDDVERADVERRLPVSDDATRAWFAGIVDSVHEAMALSASATAAAPPASLRASILAAVDADAGTAVDASAPKGATVVSLDDRRRRRFRVLAAAAAAVVVVGVGSVVAQQTVFSSDTPSATSQVLAADDVRTSTVDVTGGGTATVRWSRSQDAAVVTLDGLEAPGDGKVFEMWLIGSDPAPRPVGLVAPDAANSTREHVVTGLGDASTWAVSVEPDGGSPAPTTTPIVAVTLAA